MDYINVKDLSFSYGSEQVLTGISFHVKPGEFVILTGENGAAKSTLLRLILGLIKPQKGRITLATHNQYHQKLLVGYAPQHVSSFNVGFPSTVYDLVASGRYAHRRWFKALDQHDKAHIEKSLKSVDMWDFRYKRIGELSGGQKQRVYLARLFAKDPDLFILDEPTTGMDSQSRKKFYDLLRHSCRHHGKSVLMVTHADDLLSTYVDQHIQLIREENVSWRCFSMTSCKERS